ncbi:MAG: DUF433 domain-containing protein [Rhizobiales bacterium]|nr:DUF433 domain-containing protein [Hyphomicrobiales bacterium]
MSFARIGRDPAVMGGKPCIRGARVTVGAVVGQLGVGASIEDVLRDYPCLTEPDMREAIRYAARLAQGRDIALDAAE